MPGRTAPSFVHEFSSVALRNGDARTIAVLSRPGDRPAVALSRFRAGQALTRALFHEFELAPLERALELVRDRDFVGTEVTGKIPNGPELILTVKVHATGTERYIAIGRQRAADGTHVGRATELRGLEIDALGAAIDELRRRAADAAPTTKGR
jgi:hypothetical protein